MKRTEIDILFLADPRFQGGSSTALIAELDALKRAGITPALCPILSPMLHSPKPFHPGIVKRLATGQVQLCDATEPIRARLVIIHHPRLFEDLPAAPLDVLTEVAILVLHHPPFDGFGRAEYDLPHILANLSEVLGAEILLAPAGPAVRMQLTLSVTAGHRVIEDWSNVFDPGDLPYRSPRQPDPGSLVIGRHSRPQLEKFPDTREDACLIYPEHPSLQVRMLGAGAEVAAHFAPVPFNWRLIGFCNEPTTTFLSQLDLYVYYHSRRWIEAFGYGPAEAMASGLPTILPPQFQLTFGPAALYAPPEEAWPLARQLAHDPQRCTAQGHVARAEILGRFGPDRYLPRLRAVRPDLTRAVRSGGSAVRAENKPRRVLFITSNGVGLGHLTRAMAIARRLPTSTCTAILTMSQAFRLAVDAGFLTQFVPHYRLTGAQPEAWNRALAAEISDFIALLQPNCVVFDGNNPYPGLLSALERRASAKRIWVRRALWSGSNEHHVEHQQRFDMVIEPGELSARFDKGPTSGAAGICKVAPILGLEPDERFPAHEARQALNLPPNGTVVAMMLGAGTNFDLQPIRKRLTELLLARKDLALVELLPPIRGRDAAPPRPGLRQIELYPAYRFSRAFDAMIAGAGYNTFHENLLGGIPTLFVANEAAEMDRQILRARHATLTGCGLMVRADDAIGLASSIEALMDPDRRTAMRQRMARLPQGDGAAEAAGIIHDITHALRFSDIARFD